MTVRFKDELTDLEKLALVPISYSRLNTYFDKQYGCKAKYFYQYIQKEKQDFGPYALLGNVVHEVLENVLDDGLIVTPHLSELLKMEFDFSLANLDTEGIITEQMQIVGVDMLNEFVDRHVGERLIIEEKELAFEVVIGSALVRGFIDRIDVHEKRVVITDYKSGKQEVPQKNIPHNLQLGIYALVAEKLYPGKEIFAQLYYLRSGRQKGHLFTRDDLSAIETNLTSLVNELMTRQNFEPTPNARACYGCSFAKNGVCPTGARRLR